MRWLYNLEHKTCKVFAKEGRVKEGSEAQFSPVEYIVCVAIVLEANCPRAFMFSVMSKSSLE